LGKYLAIHLSQEEIRNNNLKSVIPKKVKTGGRKVGMAFLDSDLDREGNEKWDWKGKRKEPSSLQKKRMVTKAMEIAVITIMDNHLYQFDGQSRAHWVANVQRRGIFRGRGNFVTE
jgi:hypothetical protein